MRRWPASSSLAPTSIRTSRSGIGDRASHPVKPRTNPGRFAPCAACHSGRSAPPLRYLRTSHGCARLRGPYPRRMDDDRHTTSLVPELDVTELARSLAFYIGVVGFTLVFERPAERFAYLAINDAEVMLQEADGPGRRFRTAPLERPFGRGIYIQILVPAVDARCAAARAAVSVRVVPLEERRYDVDVVTPSGRCEQIVPMSPSN